MKIDLNDKVVLVTGAGRGIGREIALMSAEAGASVVLAARSRDQLDEVASKVESMGGAVRVVPVDLREPSAAGELIKAAIDRFGKIDVLVNNAGANSIANLVMSKEDDFRAVYELNVFAVFQLTKAAVRHMIRAKWGRIINISSVSAKYGSAYNSAYASSKAAVLGFTRSVARETAQLGITSNAICPWHVRTELVDDAMGRRAKMFGKTSESYLADIVASSPMKRLIEAREVGSLAVYLMSDLAAGITGQSLNVCGGTMME
ncbi:SDR family NAD(P)-dependent oxidoreductase [Sorangium sp. So ce291]|uniref:SDR family NAD(P)-dependent oxidoreductase n=1 Tax=Sorangium sp. So ce291 TaxID=3133294 RepID=UPI003F6435C5